MGKNYTDSNREPKSRHMPTTHQFEGVLEENHGVLKSALSTLKSWTGLGSRHRHLTPHQAMQQLLGTAKAEISFQEAELLEKRKSVLATRIVPPESAAQTGEDPPISKKIFAAGLGKDPSISR